MMLLLLPLEVYHYVGRKPLQAGVVTSTALTVVSDLRWALLLLVKVVGVAAAAGQRGD